MDPTNKLYSRNLSVYSLYTSQFTDKRQNKHERWLMIDWHSFSAKTLHLFNLNAFNRIFRAQANLTSNLIYIQNASTNPTYIVHIRREQKSNSIFIHTLLRMISCAASNFYLFLSLLNGKTTKIVQLITSFLYINCTSMKILSIFFWIFLSSIKLLVKCSQFRCSQFENYFSYFVSGWKNH